MDETRIARRSDVLQVAEVAVALATEQIRDASHLGVNGAGDGDAEELDAVAIGVEQWCPGAFELRILRGAAVLEAVQESSLLSAEPLAVFVEAGLDDLPPGGVVCRVADRPRDTSCIVGPTMRRLFASQHLRCVLRCNAGPKMRNSVRLLLLFTAKVIPVLQTSRIMEIVLPKHAISGELK